MNVSVSDDELEELLRQVREILGTGPDVLVPISGNFILRMGLTLSRERLYRLRHRQRVETLMDDTDQMIQDLGLIADLASKGQRICPEAVGWATHIEALALRTQRHIRSLQDTSMLSVNGFRKEKAEESE